MSPHPEERRLRRVSKDEEYVAKWFETRAKSALLTMRRLSYSAALDCGVRLARLSKRATRDSR
jgi:hypothetical protein